ncbi:ATP-binding protein [Serratia plymuthica]|uniref:ATP-binding protein n=1 Tax=Serratia plymuthica TaxID=82996 RepID=UPI003DA30B32
MAKHRRKAKTSGKSISGHLDSIAPEKALCEYIWNSFDANAKNISVEINANGIGGLSSIVITDDGDGIKFDELDQTFGNFLDSQKNIKRTPITRGKKGRGRYTFFKFADRATWTSWNNNETFDIEIVSTHLNEYVVSDVSASDRESHGVCIVFDPVIVDEDYFKKIIIPHIINDVSWLLVAKPHLNLVIDNNKILPISYTSNVYVEDVNDFSFDIKTTLWSQKPESEKSYIYFMDIKNEVVHKILSDMNHKGFYCSSYVSSEWFDGFDRNGGILSESERSIDSDIFKEITLKVKRFLRDEYRDYKNNAADQLIQQYLKEGVFPDYNGENILLNEFKRSQLISTIKIIFEAEPSVFSKNLNQKQKKILIKLIDRIVETNNISNLFDILEGVISLNETEVEKLSSLLRRTSLSNITKTITHIKDRNDVLSYFHKLLYDFKKESYEVKHIQKCVEENLWLFGEQYNLLTSEEDDFDKALRRYLSAVSGFSEEHFSKYIVEHPDKNKEMDIFAAQRGKRYLDNGEEYFHCVVIELKRPSIKLGDTEFEQIKKYKNVISSTDQFDDEKTLWDFILVGNEISDSKITAANINAELASNRIHGEFGLAQKDGNKRIYVKTWKQILNDFELRYDDIFRKLKVKELEVIKSTPDDIANEIGKLA